MVMVLGSEIHFLTVCCVSLFCQQYRSWNVKDRLFYNALPYTCATISLQQNDKLFKISANNFVVKQDKYFITYY